LIVLKYFEIESKDKLKQLQLAAIFGEDATQGCFYSLGLESSVGPKFLISHRQEVRFGKE